MSQAHQEKRSKEVVFATAILFLTVNFTSFLLITQSKETVSVPTNISEATVVRNTSKVSISFVGDLLMHTAERKSGYNEASNTYNFDYFFKDIKKYFDGKDYVIGSLETPIGKETSDKLYSGYPTFYNPPEFALASQKAGINVFVTSNNHVLDRGEKGTVKTMEWVEKYGIPYSGTFKTSKERLQNPVLFLNKNEIKIALVNYTESLNSSVPKNNYMVNIIEPNQIKKDIQFAKASKADVIIAWLHFGTEYQRYPNDKQKQIVKEAIDDGADIIIGSHPHVIEPMEVIDISGRKVFVAYAIGNFISNQYWRYSTDGMILNVDLEKKDGKTSFNNINYIPTAVVREYSGPQTSYEKAVKESDKESDFITSAISRGVLKGNEVKFRIVSAEDAIYDYENKLDKNLTYKDYIRLKTTWNDTTGLIGENNYFKVYRNNKMNKLAIGSAVIEKPKVVQTPVSKMVVKTKPIIKMTSKLKH